MPILDAPIALTKILIAAQHDPKQQVCYVVQPSRVYEEQILAAPFLIDIARKTLKFLYAAFIDHKETYDRVHKLKLIQYLDSRGCGGTFLRALQHSMTSSGVLGNVTFSTHSGVKQGGRTSCNSFTGYIAPAIDAVKSCGPDIWQGDINILLFIDDSVILASSSTMTEQTTQTEMCC